MEFQLLGPLEVHRSGQRVHLRGRRQRALLAALLLQANSVVTFDHLAAALWETTPAAWASNIRTYIAELRRTFRAAGESDTLIATKPGGYLLTVQASDLDLTVFHDLARCGDQALRQRDFPAAARYLGQALGRWRGQPLAGESLGPGLVSKLVGVTELRLIVAEHYAVARIEMGQPHEVVDDLRDLVTENPLREELWALLMRALYRSGQRAEALDAFASARHHLVRELGIEPGPRLQQLQRAVLSDATGADLGPQPVDPAGVNAWRQLPMDIAEFTGRQAELRQLLALIGAGGHGSPTAVAIVAIEGMAGAGKTRLAVHLAHQLTGPGYYDEIQLWADLRGFDPEHSPADPASVLDSFLLLLGVPGDQIPQGLEPKAALYRDRLAGKRALILLDNAAREDQVRPLLPGAPGSLVLITSRRGLPTLHGAHVLRLNVLARDEAVALLARISNDGRIEAEPDAAARVAELCGHLPIALSLAGRRLQARPVWTVQDLAGRLARDEQMLSRLSPETVNLHSIFNLSYRAVSAEHQRMFRLLGLHVGVDFTAESAAALFATTPEHAEPMLEAMLDEHLLQQVVVGRYRFHDLMRIYARERACSEDTPTQREDAIHRLLTWYLHTAESARGTLDPRRARIIDLPTPPPRVIVPRFPDHEHALAWFEAERTNLVTAVGMAADCGLNVVAWQLPWVLLSFFYRRSHWPDWIATYRIALGVTRSIGERRGEGVIWRGLGVAHSDLREFATAIDCHQQAQAILHEVGDRNGQAWNLNNLGVVYVELNQLNAAADCFGKALGMFRETNDRHGEGICLNNLGDTNRRLGQPERAIAHLTEALAVQREADDQAGLQYTLSSLGDVRRDTRDYEAALRHYRNALAISRTLDNNRLVGRILANVADTHDAIGDLDTAIEHWRSALAIFSDLGDSQADGIRLQLDKHTQAR